MRIASVYKKIEIALLSIVFSLKKRVDLGIITLRQISIDTLFSINDKGEYR